MRLLKRIAIAAVAAQLAPLASAQMSFNQPFIVLSTSYGTQGNNTGALVPGHTIIKDVQLNADNSGMVTPVLGAFSFIAMSDGTEQGDAYWEQITDNSTNSLAVTNTGRLSAPYDAMITGAASRIQVSQNRGSVDHLHSTVMVNSSGEPQCTNMRHNTGEKTILAAQIPFSIDTPRTATITDFNLNRVQTGNAPWFVGQANLSWAVARDLNSNGVYDLGDFVVNSDNITLNNSGVVSKDISDFPQTGPPKQFGLPAGDLLLLVAWTTNTQMQTPLQVCNSGGATVTQRTGSMNEDMLLTLDIF